MRWRTPPPDPPPRFRDNVPGSSGFLGRVRAKAWEDFVVMAVEALRQAAAILHARALPNDHQVDGYWGDGRYDVLGTAVSLPMENGITDPLVRALDIVRAGAHRNHALKKLQVTVAQQQPRATQYRVGSRALTTDIQIRSLAIAHLDLRIEAKVLFDGGDAATYCGPDGLARFSDPEPYTDQPVGMMIGYSVRREDAHWFDAIARHTAEGPAVRWRSDILLGAETILATLSSSHATGEVLVCHVIIPFETEPSSRALDAARASRRGRHP